MSKVDFPYGKKRDWELDTADADIGLKQVPESLVILQSLRQSRDTWISHTFPKFTTKARGAKAPEPPPPPHTIQLRGRCDLAIGPHIFPETMFYEVHYLQTASVTPSLQAPSTSPSTTNPYSSYFGIATQSAQAPSTTTPASVAPSSVSPPTPAPPESPDSSSIRLALGGGMEYTITSDLVARIHREASVNPIFASKFRLAVDPNATQEQIRNFAFALPHLPGVRVSGIPTSLVLTTETIHLPPVREWDLVIEFSEAPTERWLVPRGTLASCSRLAKTNDISLSDICLTIRLPLPETQPKATSAHEPSSTTTSPESEPNAVKFTLRKAPVAVYDLVLSWIGGDNKNTENAEALAKLPSRQKIFLSHRITQGSLLSQLQAAQTPNYTMKPLKQGPTNPPRPRRKQAPKAKPAVQKPAVALSAESTTTPTATVAAPTTTTNTTNTTTVTKPKEPKRRRYQSSTKPAPVPIRCLVCFKTDVPLMMGGRYCRECVDAGKANVAIPQLPRATQSYSFTPYAPSATVSPAPTAAPTTTPVVAATVPTVAPAAAPTTVPTTVPPTVPQQTIAPAAPASLQAVPPSPPPSSSSNVASETTTTTPSNGVNGQNSSSSS